MSSISSVFVYSIWSPVQYVKQIYLTSDGSQNMSKATILIDWHTWNISVTGSLKVNGKSVSTQDDATAKANAALNSAKSDATAKANAALTSAQSYFVTNNRVVWNVACWDSTVWKLNLAGEKCTWTRVWHTYTTGPWRNRTRHTSYSTYYNWTPFLSTIDYVNSKANAILSIATGYAAQVANQAKVASVEYVNSKTTALKHYLKSLEKNNVVNTCNATTVGSKDKDGKNCTHVKVTNQNLCIAKKTDDNAKNYEQTRLETDETHYKNLYGVIDEQYILTGEYEKKKIIIIGGSVTPGIRKPMWDTRTYTYLDNGNTKLYFFNKLLNL